MRLPFFDPPREDVAAVASDLIIRLGLHARDEALSSEAHHAGYFFGRAAAGSRENFKSFRADPT